MNERPSAKRHSRGNGRARFLILVLFLLGAEAPACVKPVSVPPRSTPTAPSVLWLGDDRLRVQPATIAFVDGGKTLVAGNERGTRYVDLQTGRVLREGPPATLLVATPDGRWLLAVVEHSGIDTKGALHSALSLRDPTTGAEARSIRFPDYPPRRARWSKDGRALFLRVSNSSCGPEIEVTLSDLLADRIDVSPCGGPQARDPLQDLALPLEPAQPTKDPRSRTEQRAEVLAFAWSPSGARVAVELKQGAVLLFDRDLHHPRRLDWPGTGGAYSGDLDQRLSFVGEDRLALASGTSGVRVFDLASGALVRNLPSRAHEKVTTSPDGKLIVTWGANTGVQLWDAATGAEKLPHAGHRGLVSALAFAPDGAKLVTGAWDGTVRAWDAQTGKEERVLAVGSPIAGLAVDGSGRLALNAYNRVEVWRLADATRVAASMPADGSNTNVAIAFTPDGGAVEYHASYGNPIYRWDPEAHQVTASRDDPTLARVRELFPDSQVALSADGARAVVAEHGAAVLHELPSSKELDRLSTDALASLALARDGKAFAVGERDGRIVWIGFEGGPRRELRPWGNVAVTALAFSPDGRVLACGSAEGNALLWRPGE